MSEDRKCSKPGCGAMSILGKACLDRDCPQTWVHYTAHNAEIERLTRERDEALNLYRLVAAKAAELMTVVSQAEMNIWRIRNDSSAAGRGDPQVGK